VIGILWAVVILLMVPQFSYGAVGGMIVALKGKGSILHDKAEVPAKLKDRVAESDMVKTGDASRLKILFDDDSIVTLGPNSTLVVREFLYDSEGKKGKSILNLMDGKMRSLTGRTKFEVHTPTAVAAARGTFFITWVEPMAGRLATGVTVVEGLVDVQNADPAVTGMFTVAPGQVSTIAAKAAPAAPTVIAPEVLQGLLKATEVETEPESSAPSPESVLPEGDQGEAPAVNPDGTAAVPQPAPEPSPDSMNVEIPQIPPLDQQPPAMTPVRIELTFPD
jgi:hypothetical protein